MGQFRWKYITLFSVISLQFQILTAQYSGGVGRGDALCSFEMPYSPMYFGGISRGDAMCNYLSPSAPFYAGGSGRGDAICMNNQPLIPLFDGGDGRGDAICYEVIPPLSLFSGGEGRGDAMCFEDEIPLPIILASYSGHCWDNEVTLVWSTYSEMNNDYYLIEISHDGMNWDVVDSIPGAGTSNNINEYSATYFSNRFTNYFRLKQIDFDGTEALFNPILINCEEESLSPPILFPNPTNGNFNIKGFGDSADIQIYDASGKLIYETIVFNDYSEIKFEHSEPGMYIVRISTQKQIYTDRLIIAY